MADPEASQDYTSDAVVIIDSQTDLGQSFISRRPNLNGITFWISSPPPPANTSSTSQTINIKLFNSIGDSTPVFSSSIYAPASASNVPINISLPNLGNLAGQSYYLFLSTTSSSIQINGRNEDAYPQGQAYINGNGIGADIAFQLSYDYDLSALVQDLAHLAASSWLIFPLLIILYLPGWLLLNFAGIRSRFDFIEAVAISIGLSLAIIPVAMVWTTLLNIKWSRQLVFFIAGFLIALWIVRLIYAYIIKKKNQPSPDQTEAMDQRFPASKKISLRSLTSIALTLIFLVSLAIRLIMVRDLATPAWVDSVHHALITRLILNAGGYPSSFQPYLNISPTDYHPGFHSIAATFIWLTNLDLAKSLLILGQILNALSVFSVYLLAKTLTRRSTAGLFAAFVTGFLTPMPAYYTSWGRYTELTGLLILPVVLALIQTWLDEKAKKKTVGIILLGALASGGLFMIHYRVVVFLAGLILFFVLYQLIFEWKTHHGKPLGFIFLVLGIALLGMTSVFPWFIQTVKTTFLAKVSLPVVSSVSFFQDFSWPYLTSAYGKQAMVVAGLGFFWSLIKRRSMAFILGFWILILFFLANLGALKLPGAGLITNLSVEIMLFIPISILAGYFLDQTLMYWKDLIPKQLILPSVGVIFLIFGLVAYQGARQLIPIINPVTILSRQADLQAIQWIGDNIPAGETIVINPFAWGYGLYAGNDGGYWISPLSGRLTLPPPVLYGLGNNYKEINSQAQQIYSSSTDPIKFWEYLNSRQYHFVYVGARGGVISPEKLSSSGLFSVLYHKTSVWIFGVTP